MASQGTLIWLCSLAVLSSSVAQDETLPPQNCSSQTQLLEHLKVAAECGDDLPAALSEQQTARALLLMRNVTETLHRQQLRDCQGAEPKKCPEADVPENGGLVCVTVENKRYCKPMCNHGYDFGFLRRSRAYDECSEQTGYRWQTAYVGGNRLAVCNETPFQISGAKTAYFPKDTDCLTMKSSDQLQRIITEVLTCDLESQGIQGQLQNACLVCG